MEAPRRRYIRPLPACALALATLFVQPERGELSVGYAAAAESSHVATQFDAAVAMCLPGREGQYEIGTIDLLSTDLRVTCTKHASIPQKNAVVMSHVQPPLDRRANNISADAVAAAIAARTERLRQADLARTLHLQGQPPILPTSGGTIVPSLVLAGAAAALVSRRRIITRLRRWLAESAEMDTSTPLPSAKHPPAEHPRSQREIDDQKDGILSGRRAICARVCERLGDRQRLTEVEQVFDLLTQRGDTPSAPHLRAHFEALAAQVVSSSGSAPRPLHTVASQAHATIRSREGGALANDADPSGVPHGPSQDTSGGRAGDAPSFTPITNDRPSSAMAHVDGSMPVTPPNSADWNKLPAGRKH